MDDQIRAGLAAAGVDVDEALERFMGSEAEVRLYKPENGVKAFVGRLCGYDSGDVELEIDGEARRFEKKNIAAVRLHVSF